MAATNPVMPRITPPRTVETFKIDQLKRQFHQWYYMEKMSLPIVKQNFDKLFYDVFRITGFKFEVT